MCWLVKPIRTFYCRCDFVLFILVEEVGHRIVCTDSMSQTQHVKIKKKSRSRCSISINSGFLLLTQFVTLQFIYLQAHWIMSTCGLVIMSSVPYIHACRLCEALKTRRSKSRKWMHGPPVSGKVSSLEWTLQPTLILCLLLACLLTHFLLAEFCFSELHRQKPATTVHYSR